MESKTIHGLSLQSQSIKRGRRYSKSHTGKLKQLGKFSISDSSLPVY